MAALALAAACWSCTEKEEVFYSVRYDVVRVEADAVLAASDGEDSATPDAEEMLRTEALAEAPVAAGGSYSLDFLRYDGGPLAVVATAGGEAVAGTFVKQPGTAVLRFLFGEADYAATLGYYADGDRRLTLLSVDLTEAFRERHPDLEIERVVRNEYTSTPYR